MTTRFETLQRTVSIPDQVSVQIEGRTVKVKGPLGHCKKICPTFQSQSTWTTIRSDWKLAGRERGRSECWEQQLPTSETCSKESHKATGTNCAQSTPTFPSQLRWMRKRRC